jgi:zinc/manganese transport system substrate-binding protein
MRSGPAVSITFFLFTTLAVLLGAARPSQAETHVVASVPDLAALAKEIGGNLVSARSLSLPTQDPHFVDAKPSLALVLNRADLLLYVGLDLEIGWLPTLIVGARNPNIQPGAKGHLDCSQFVNKMDLPRQAIDRSQGDIHPAGNPHYLYDPRAAEAVASGIAGRLAAVDPTHAADYKTGAEALVRRLQAERAGWEKRLGRFRGTPVIGYHRTWTYLCDWLGLEQIAFLEPKPGIPPNPRHVADLLVQARAKKVRIFLQEDYYPDSTARLVATRSGAQLVRVPAASNFPAGETYARHVAKVVDAIGKALESSP